MRAIVSTICLAIAIGVYKLSSSQTPPSEVKKTVDALVGHWTLHGSDAEAGGKKPLKITAEVDCRVAALGAAIACDLKGNVSGSGPIEAATIVGYDPEERIVHWMEISSTGEYHDHRGKWIGQTITFEPLVYVCSGKKCTETFTLSFPSANTFILKSVTETAEGRSTITGTAKKH
jgi:Protein of unknown function (DUF1579)